MHYWNFQDEIEREARKKKKLENAKNTVEGRHGGKHYFEDEEYIKSKKETTGKDKHAKVFSNLVMLQTVCRCSISVRHVVCLGYVTTRGSTMVHSLWNGFGSSF